MQSKRKLKARILVFNQFALLAVLAIHPGKEHLASEFPTGELSLALYGVAILLLAFAGYALRPSLGVSPIPIEGAPLITYGIYKWMRHPMYVAVSLFGIGMTISHLNAYSGTVLSALLINMYLKAKFEDQLLREIHAEAANYQEKASSIVGKR